MTIHIRAGDIHLLELRTRMPFKYGIATMTHSPHAFLRLQVEVDGTLTSGIAADHLPPKWFTKDPSRGIEEEVEEMLLVIEHALQTSLDLRGDSPFAAWRQLFELQDAWGREKGLAPLLTHFGTSLVERALIEAVCRKQGQPFHTLLRTGQLGMDLGTIHPPLKDRRVAEYLPQQPLGQLIARHTIGLADPLTDADIPAAERLNDGLPQSLQACIQTYGLRHFKVKVTGNLERDGERLGRIAHILETTAPGDYAFSLDGNEQFRAAEEFQSYWRDMTGDQALKAFLGHLLFVEQPFHRDIALNAQAVGGLKEWVERPAMIIDESDGDLTSLPQALQLGYSGTSHKNCKGVFKGIANACLLTHLQRDNPGQKIIMSGEDLANIGPVALLQDLAVCACLGIASVERNGHHYFAGLSMFPEEVQQQILAEHGDLYHLSRDGWPTLAIREGRLTLASINVAPFGVKPRINVEQFPSR